MKNLKKQQGLSPIGWLFVISVFVFCLMTIAKLGPHYLDDRYVNATLKTLAEDPNFPRMTVSEVKDKLKKTFSINGVRGKPAKSVKVTKNSDGILVTVAYEERFNFIHNIDVVLQFNSQLSSQDPDRCCKPVEIQEPN